MGHGLHLDRQAVGQVVLKRSGEPHRCVEYESVL
jgi:hypothetical protein